MAVNVAKQSWLWVLLIIILLLLIFSWGSSPSTGSGGLGGDFEKGAAAARKNVTRSAPEAFRPLVQKNVRAKNVWEPRVVAHQVVEEVEEFDEE